MNSPRSAAALLLTALSLWACRATTPQAAPGAPAPAQQPQAGLVPALPAVADVAALDLPERVAPNHAALAARVIELGRSEPRVDEHLRALSLDIGPRLTGSTSLQKACEWAQAQFASLGLEARLERWGEFPVGFDRGAWRGGMVAPETLDFEFHTMAWTAGTNGPARGRALRFPMNDEEFAALAGQLAGVWLVRPPMSAKQPANALVERVQDALVAQGGLGEVRGSRGELLVTDGRWQLEADALPKLVSVRVVKQHHDALWARLEAGAAVELEFDIDNRFVPGPVTQYNVVADLRGASKPDEIVIVCGHLDTWDGAQGVVDNGTGCATTLEAARLLVRAGARPERTIRFILWTGEEQGLFGSKGYVKEHADELPRISAVLNHDGGTNYLSGLRGSYEMEAQLREACAPLFELDPQMPFEVRAGDGMQVSPDSDHWPFFAAGVPGFFWRQSGRSNYTRHHHTQFDTLDAAIPEYQRHSAIVVAVTALGIANLPELLDRTNMQAPEPRRMGVRFDGTKVSSVMEGRAKAAGLAVGDVVAAIDGREVATQEALQKELQAGEPRKLFRVVRGAETLELTLDWSDDPQEPKRAERARARAERELRASQSGAQPEKR